MTAGRHNDPAPKKKRRICGLTRPVFILLGIILPLLAALGGAIGGLITKNNKDKKSGPGLAQLPAIDQQPDLSSDGYYFIKTPLFLGYDYPVLGTLPDKLFANATRSNKADNHSHFQFQHLPDTHTASAAYRRFFNISAPLYVLKTAGTLPTWPCTSNIGRRWPTSGSGWRRRMRVAASSGSTLIIAAIMGTAVLTMRGWGRIGDCMFIRRMSF